MFFDSDTVEDTGFELLAKGDYNFIVTNVEYGPNKAGNGSLLTLELAVENTETKIFHRFNLEHPNQKAANIGKAELKKFCVLVGRPKLNQPHDLMSAKIKGTVVHKEFNGDTYANVKKFKEYESTGIIAAPQAPNTPDKERLPF